MGIKNLSHLYDIREHSEVMRNMHSDTSGISILWSRCPKIFTIDLENFKTNILPSGIIAVTQEIYAEMESIPGSVAKALKTTRQISDWR